MSLAEVLFAAQTTIIAYFQANGESSANDRIISVQPFGQPPPALSGFKDYFIGIDCNDYSPGDTNETNEGLHEVLGFQVVVSRKITHSPKSEYQAFTYDQLKGVYSIARKVMLACNGSQDLLSFANQHLEGDKFFIAPHWRGTSTRPELKGADWLNVAEDSFRGCVLVVTVNFGGMERIQCASRVTVQ